MKTFRTILLITGIVVAGLAYNSSFARNLDNEVKEGKTFTRKTQKEKSVSKNKVKNPAVHSVFQHEEKNSHKSSEAK